MRAVTALSRKQLMTLFRWLHFSLCIATKSEKELSQALAFSEIDSDYLVQFIRETFMIEYSDDAAKRPLFRLEKVPM